MTIKGARMSKTNDIRKLVQSKLKTVFNHVYYENADENTMYPHCVFSFSSIDLGDLSRDDLILNVDVWDRSTSAFMIEDLCDDVEALFNCQNMPQDTILPTFFRINRVPVNDEDKKIRHRLLKFQIQNYER